MSGAWRHCPGCRRETLPRDVAIRLVLEQLDQAARDAERGMDLWPRAAMLEAEYTATTLLGFCIDCWRRSVVLLVARALLLKAVPA